MDDHLLDDVRRAERLGYGVHYGHYKADFPHTRADPPDAATPEPRTKICKFCGAAFAPAVGLGSYCSSECRRERQRRQDQRKRQQRMASLEIRTCPVCGEAFAPSHKDQIYCGRSCGSKAKGKISRLSAVCPTCGKPFQLRTRTSKYCSAECYRHRKTQG